jgi:outer membrane lipoprotein SlyB
MQLRSDVMSTMYRFFGVLLAACAVLLSACQSVPPPGISGQGVVQSIQETQQASTTGNVVGAIGGALVGGALGSLVGGGTGQTIATTVGAVGGSIAGSSVASKAAAETVWVVNIRFDDGINRTVTVSQRPNYRPGDKVRVDNGAVFPLTAK